MRRPFNGPRTAGTKMDFIKKAANAVKETANVAKDTVKVVKDTAKEILPEDKTDKEKSKESPEEPQQAVEQTHAVVEQPADDENPSPPPEKKEEDTSEKPAEENSKSAKKKAEKEQKKSDKSASKGSSGGLCGCFSCCGSCGIGGEPGEKKGCCSCLPCCKDTKDNLNDDGSITSCFGKKIENLQDKMNLEAGKWLSKNKGSLVARFVYTASAFINAIIGLAVFVLSILNIIAFPSITTLCTRMLTSGVVLIQNAFSIICCSSLCCVCITPSPAKMRRNFLAGYTTSIECLLFGLWYLVFPERWQDLVTLYGNKGWIWTINKTAGTTWAEAQNAHFAPLMISSWLLVASAALTVVGMICAMYLLSPVNFMKQLRFIAYQILTISGSEFIFIGTFFSAAQTFASSHGPALTSVISIGGVLDTFLLVIGILRTCTKCCCPTHWIIFVEILTGIVTVIVMVVGIVFTSTLDHTKKLITTSVTSVCNMATPSEKYCTDVVAGITKAVCGASSTFSDKQDYCGTPQDTWAKSVAMMIEFSSAVDSWVILSAFLLFAFMLIALVAIVAVQCIVRKKEKDEDSPKKLTVEETAAEPPKSPEESAESAPPTEVQQEYES
ncbi:hypothetical protein BLNAU_22602 [Blattamonas nauphoetae]|uniref:Transmembrane protein n=1 Tax=Blattamonas nauphoetae TaxID=2049346 RepID=A0ABQ9WVN5_9EUKA|nr:hypothetical protein BLNAU_22602 [Blattamonas nauphoetae]